MTSVQELPIDLNRDDVMAVANAVMSIADRNKNGELTATELTCMLEGSVFQDFGRWIGLARQQGFRKYDGDCGGTIALDELAVLVPSSPLHHFLTDWLDSGGCCCRLL